MVSTFINFQSISLIIWIVASENFGNHLSLLHCSINVVTEEGPNSYGQISKDISDLNKMITRQVFNQTQVSWMYYSVAKLNLSFDAAQLETTRINIRDGYFRFNSKNGHHSCVAFLLWTKTLNTTVIAISKSGYATSDNALFLIIGNFDRPGQNEIIVGFRAGYPGVATGHVFHAHVAFLKLSTWETYIYCYLCNKKTHNKIQKFSSESLIQSISQIKAFTALWNRINGQGSHVTMYTMRTPELEEIDFTSDHCDVDTGKLFYSNSQFCHHAEILMLRQIGKSFNLTLPDFRSFGDEQDDDRAEEKFHWHTQIKWNEAMLVHVRNVYAQTRGAYHIVQQSPIKMIFCSTKSEMESMSWNVYVTVYDRATWICIFMISLVVAAVYKNLWKGLDVLWPILGMHFWTHHSRLMIFFYLIPVLFLVCIYDGEMSTDFIEKTMPHEIPNLFDRGYTIWSTDIIQTRTIFHQMEKDLKHVIQAVTGGRSFSEMFYNLVEPDYRLPSNDSWQLLRDMVQKKIIISTGIFKENSMAQLFLYAHGYILLDKRSVCAALPLPSEVDIMDVNAFRIWGYLGSQISQQFSTWFSMGHVVRLQNLINFKKALVQPLPWSEVRMNINEESAFGLHSPLGYACLIYGVTLVCSTFATFSAEVGWPNRERFVQFLNQELYVMQIILRHNCRPDWQQLLNGIKMKIIPARCSSKPQCGSAAISIRIVPQSDT